MKDTYGNILKAEFSKKRRHPRLEIALRAYIESYVYCNQINIAKKILHEYKPNRRKAREYLANAYSSIAAIRYLLNDKQTANDYFRKAMHVALPIEDETRRSDALSRIANNQITAGLYQDAFETALEIKQTNQKPSGQARDFSAFKNAVLINQSVRGGVLYPDCWVKSKLKKIYNISKAEAVHTLDSLYERVEKENIKRALIKLAIAYGKLGEKRKAETLLKRLYQEYLDLYQKKRTLQKLILLEEIDEILKAYVISVGEYDMPMKSIFPVSFSIKLSKAHNFHRTWGALIGLASKINNESLLKSIKSRLGSNFEDNSIRHSTFLYFLKTEQFERAEKLIDRMPPYYKMGAYLKLAREKYNAPYKSNLGINKTF